MFSFLGLNMGVQPSLSLENKPKEMNYPRNITNINFIFNFNKNTGLLNENMNRLFTSIGAYKDFSNLVRYTKNEETPCKFSSKEAKNQYEPSEKDESIASLIKTKNGCRYYQNMILKEKEYANISLYHELKPFMLELINDQYGHFLYKEFLNILTDDNILHFSKFIEKNFFLIAYSPYGSRIIQKLSEKANINDKTGAKIYQILSAKIKENIYTMSTNKNANYVIQKFVSSVQFPYNDFVYEELAKSFLLISKSKSGCNVIKKCFTFGNNLQKTNIINIILENAFYLISSQYSSDLIKLVILLSDDLLILKLYNALSENFFSLCKEKYSFHVIIALFEIKNKVILNEIINCLLHYKSKIIDLVCNEYGNFILQKILSSDYVNDSIKNKLLKIIFGNLDKINRTAIGQNFSNKIPHNYLINRK